MQRGFHLVLAMTLAAALIPNSIRAATERELQDVSKPAVHPVDGGLVLEWQVHPPSVELNASGETEVTLPGYSLLNQPGVAQVPFASALIALPHGAQPNMEVVASEDQVLDLPALVRSAPQPQGVLHDAQGAVIGGGFIETPGVNDFPYGAIQLEQVGVLRGVQLGRVKFYPARPDGDRLRITTQIQVAVWFNDPAGSGLSQIEAVVDPLLEQVKSYVVNPDNVSAWVRSNEREGVTNRVETVEAKNTAVIEVEQAGIVAISYADLTGISFPLSGVNPANLQLTRGGTPIAYQWEGDGDAMFEDDERLLFYAEPRFSRYTYADVYFLTSGSAAGLKMSSRSASPSALLPGAPHVEATFETNDIYTPNCYCGPLPAGRDGDRWVWDRLQKPDRISVDYPFDLPDVDAAQAASLKLWLIGYTDIPAANPDHKVDVILNGDTTNKLGTIVWDGKQAIAESFSIPANKLLTGENTLTLTLPGITGVNVESMWLDAFQIQYARSSALVGNSIAFSGESSQHAYTLGLSGNTGLHAYEITNPGEPIILNNLTVSGTVKLGDPAGGGVRRYWVTNQAGIASPSRLRLLSTPPPSGGADYVIIAPGKFVSALAPLVALRENQGYQVAVATLQAVYDHFGEGRAEPAAIRDYLSQAYQSWNPQPLYVLLVGDGTSDPKQYQSYSSETILPPFLADVDPWAGETAADNRYVTVDGSDNLPDMLIGRLPVNNLSEAQTVVSKIVTYESSPPAGTWNQTMVFVADDADSGGNFPVLTKSVVETYLPPGFLAEQLLYIPSTISAGEIRDQLLETWQDGPGLVMYTGHSSILQWAVEKFIHYDDVVQLTNGGRLPVVMEMTCFTSSFQISNISTLDEALVRHPSGGAIASWGATGLGLATGHKALAEGFMENIFHSEQKDLGSAALEGKLRLLQLTPVYIDLVDTYTLLGDPATRINLPTWTDTLFVPLIQN